MNWKRNQIILGVSLEFIERVLEQKVERVETHPDNLEEKTPEVYDDQEDTKYTVESL